ncbi:MAG TPA: MarR family transcriptional regulator [Euzebyales bacterium]|nr:MarR family transcriptional regulator [Euzebyales bacterium]
MNKLHHSADAALERLFEVAGVLADAMRLGLNGSTLTPARAEIVWRIGQQGPMTQRQLSTALRCTPRNVTGLVDALEDLGLVTRQPHPTDRRATLVTLTDRGGETARDWQVGYRQLASHLFGDMDADELTGVVTLLDHVLERLRGPTADITRSGHADQASSRAHFREAQHDGG